MGSERFAGYFMLVTAVVVAIPVVLQLRAREADWKYAWSPILFVVGLATIGAGYAFAAEADQRLIAITGIAAMQIGLVFAQRTRKSEPRT